MRVPAALRLRLRCVFHRHRVERELDAELEATLAMMAAEQVARGVPRERALRMARIALGGIEPLKERCRDVRPLHWLDEVMRDVRLATRGLRRTPSFAAAVILMLGLGIGATVTVFSVLHAVVLRPLPYADPDTLAMVLTHNIAQNQPDGTAIPDAEDWRAQSESFTAFAYYRRTHVSQVTISDAEGPQRVQEGLVGPGFFELLGTPPLRGRAMTDADFARGERVVVISEGLWRDRFGAGDVLGRSLAIDREDHVIVGVMPQAFQLPERETRLWRPLSATAWWSLARPVRDADGVVVIGRLGDGVSLEDAQAEMHTIAARLRREYPDTNANRGVRVVSLFDQVVGRSARAGVWVLFASVLSLLLIACANVGGLLVARASLRAREMAVRAALGAGRARLMRQLLVEGLMLAVPACAAGILFAYNLLPLLLTRTGLALPRFEQVEMSLPVLGFALTVGGVALVAFAGLPALVVSRPSPVALIGRASARATGGQGKRLEPLLVVGQLGFAFVLLAGAALMIQSLTRAAAEDPGFPGRELIVVSLDLPRATYPDGPSIEAFYQEAIERLSRLPGVSSVGAMRDFFIRQNPDLRIVADGGAYGIDDGRAPRLMSDSVTLGYFEAMGIPILEGRDFTEHDLGNGMAPVAIVDVTMARAFWPGQSAIGKRWRSVQAAEEGAPWITVVGVVAGMRRQGLDVAPIPSVFLPNVSRRMDVSVRTATSPSALVPAVRQQIREIDETLPLAAATILEEHLDAGLGGRRLEAELLGFFAAMAMLLSALGLYSLLAHHVAVRTREIGVRTTLGAAPRQILAMVVGRGARFTLVGLAVGLLAAVGVTRSMQSLLYGTSALDPASYAAAVGLLLAVGIAACAGPAARAVAVDPAVALRSE